MAHDLMRSIGAASSGMSAQSFRLRVASENLSNVDTNGYKRKTLTFEQVHDRLLDMNRVAVGDVTIDRSQGKLDYNPSHPLADANGFVELSNVNLMIELADAREASRSYEANLTTFRQAFDMYRSLIDVLRS